MILPLRSSLTRFAGGLSLLAFSASLALAQNNQPINGAIYTTVSDGTVVNANVQYGSKDEVYLNGGPQNHQDPGLRPDGLYYFQVTSPTGSLDHDVLLSSDPAADRLLLVLGGRVVGSAGTHVNGTYNPANGTTPVQLFPFGDTPNPGGEYKAWLIWAADATVDPTDERQLRFNHDNAKTDNFKIRVTAPETLQINCPASLSVPNDPGKCGAVVNNYGNYTTSGGSGAITVTANPAPGSLFPIGTTTVTLTATDASGKTAQCQFAVTVNDTERPVLTCPANMSRITDPSLCSAIVNFSATATDNCPGTTVVSVPASGSVFTKGTTTVTSTATDAAGNTATCTFTVTVNDTEPPAITCPQNIVVNTDLGLCSAIVNFSPPAVTDNCDGGMLVCTPASGTAFAKGTTTVTCVATDLAGNTSKCSFTVTVNDAEAPVIKCPANFSVSTDPSLCSAVVNFAASVTDNCLGATVVCSPVSGTAFAKGTTTVTATATDASGNTATCTFTVTVNDAEAPGITCPKNISVSTDPARCSAVVDFAATAKDNCPGVTVVCSPASGTAFPKGTTTVTATATDASGNTATCAFTVTVSDTEAPVINCPKNLTFSTDPLLCSAVVKFDVTATDNCPGEVSLVASPASGSVFPKGPSAVTVTATDAAGNVSTCSFTVTVNDAEAPVVKCPANISVSTDPALCSAVVDFAATVTDNCPGATVVCSPASGTAFAKGTTTVTATATDASGNKSTCSFTVTVKDTEFPKLTLPANISVATDPGQCSAVVNYSVLAAENCPGVALTYSGLPSGAAFPKGTTTVTYTATDTSGNATTGSFTVTVTDTEKPVVTAPANIADCLQTINGSTESVGTATATDNCGIASVVGTRSDGRALTAPYAVGTTTITWTATDVSGNVSTATQTVTITAGSIVALKFYDANANGSRDANEVGITGWKITLTGKDSAGNTVTSVTGLTGAGGMITFGNLALGNYSVTEATSVTGTWMAITPKTQAVALNQCATPGSVAFGNVSLGAGGGLTLGFWSNKNGQATMGGTTAAMTTNLAALSALNLRSATGANFDPATYATYNSWLLSANATNMAYMLSAQLTAMYNNVNIRPNNFGGVNGSALIYAPGATGANAAGFMTVSALITGADAALGANGLTVTAGATRTYQEALKTALDNGNNNRNFIQAAPTVFSF